MTLLDRIAREDSLPTNERVGGHLVQNAITIYVHGHVTRNQMINFFNIPGGMLTDFDKFKTKYDSLNTVGKGNWLLDLDSSITLLQAGILNKAKFNNILGLDLDET